jgi:ribose 1,5-bisphosphokinase PhnN
MSAIRRLARSKRRAMGDKPCSHVDAMVRVHPEVDRLVTDAELTRARHRMPPDVARSRVKAREWESRINRRLAVPEHVRMQFAPVALLGGKHE